MPVGNERGRIVVRRICCAGGREEGWQREEVAGGGWAGGDEGEDFGEETLLDCCVLRWWLVRCGPDLIGDVPIGCRISLGEAGRCC